MIELDGDSLTIEDVVSVRHDRERVRLAERAVPGIEKSRALVDRLVSEGRVVYGITTGVGTLANRLISPDDVETLQLNLVRSHATSVGEPFPEDVVRGIILLRAAALAKGCSGVRPELVQFLLDLLNHDIYPRIPPQGSVGASGDLSPLAHLALVVVGEGECIEEGRPRSARDVLDAVGLKPMRLAAKEGLALINGTQVMASLGCLIVNRAERVMKNAQIAGAMSLEALFGTARAMDAKIHASRPHPGQIRCAENIRRLVEGSAIMAAHENCDRVQDAYTLRCIPQVYGAVMDTIDYARKVLSVEINSATDNPPVFADQGEVISGGNFHGEPLAFAMDFIGIALAEIANISERTVDRLVNPHVSGLPPLLVAKSGLHSGFMIVQYTAAALVSENKVLAHPASVDSIPTSAGQEDHVSMGTIAARHAWTILENVENVLAIELLCAAQGIDFHDPAPAPGTGVAHAVIRRHVEHLDDDRELSRDIGTVRELLTTGRIVAAVEERIGPLR